MTDSTLRGPPTEAQRKRWREKKARQRDRRRSEAAGGKPTSSPTAHAAPKQAVIPFTVGALEHARSVFAQMAANRRVNQDLNPFKLPAFPPSAMPPQGDRMAMDEAAPMQWAAQQWANSPFGLAQEGLLFLGYPLLSEMGQRPEYRTFSETTATEMTRKWIKFTSVGDEGAKAPKPGEERDPEDEAKTLDGKRQADRIKQLVDYMEHMEVRDHFANLALGDGLFGRIHLQIEGGTNDSPEEMKISIGNGRDGYTKSKIGKGWLKRLSVIEPIWCYPTAYNATNPLKEGWYKPETWFCMGTSMHRTRLVPFVSRPVPDILKPAYAFGGLSMTQMAKPYVDIWLQTRESVALLVKSFSTMVLEVDLQTMMQPGGIELMAARVNLFNELRDNQGLFTINKATEGFSNVSAPLSGLHELQSQAQEHMMSVARIPAVKFTGISPQGMNASSEGEMRAWYDTVHAAQNKFFRPGLSTVIDIAMISLWGERDEKIKWDFEPLWEMTAKEKAELQKQNAERDQTYVDMGAIAPPEVRKRVIDDPELPYGELDPEDVPDLQEEEEAGLEPAGGRPDPKAGGESGEGGGEET